MLCFLHWSPCTFGITCLCLKKYTLFASGREDSMFKFGESTDETLPYTGVMMLMEEDGLAFKGKRFPGLIWCLVNREKRQS